MLKNKEQIPFWLLTIGILILLILPRLVQDGMFPDGVLYASVAHNLAEHKGTFWFPYFDNIMFPFFHQKPPLAFGLQAIFFKYLGNSIYVERLYSFLTACFSAILIILIWIRIDIAEIKIKKLAWLPVLLWIIVPICCWSYTNNMVENTMGVFTLISVLLMLEGSRDEDWYFFFLIPGSALTILGYLCGGNGAYFPLVIPIIHYVIFRPGYSPFKLTWLMIIALATPFLIHGALVVNNHINESLIAYKHERMLGSIEDEAATHGKIYALTQLFFVELIVPIILCAAVIFFSKTTIKYWKEKENSPQWKTALLFFCIGIAASLPVLISSDQRVYYLVPSFPYYAIAFAILAAPGILKLIDKLKPATTKIIGIASLAIVAIGIILTLSKVGKTSRDKEMLQDVYTFGRLIPPDTVVRVYRPTSSEWQLHNYFVRHFNISIAADTSSEYRYFINEKSLHQLPPPAYSKLVKEGQVYDLYKKEN